MIKKILLRFCVIASLGVLLSACSGASFSYGFLDNLMRWELNKYVSLYSYQSGPVNKALDRFHGWHRSTQLPAYARFIEQQIRILERPAINTQQLNAAFDQGLRFWGVSLQQLTADSVDLLTKLDDEQRKELMDNVEKKEQEFISKYLQDSLAERKKERNERMMERLVTWIGSPTETQQQKVTQWVEQLRYDSELRLQQRRLFRQKFTALLQQKNSNPAQFKQQMSLLLREPERHWTPAYRAYLEHNKQASMRLMVELHRSLSVPQKRKLLSKLQGYQQDFLKLAAK